jgi:nucleoside-diphosphate kinase
MKIERSLVLLKPDAIQRGLIGKVISRFEDAGIKIIGSKMVWIDENHGKKHYFDVADRHGEEVLQKLLKYVTMGPVLALCLEGANAIPVIRKMVGATDPHKALPGTIRGDYAHMSLQYADANNKTHTNIIHASAKPDEAELELSLWFKPEELHTYKTTHECLCM